MRSCFCMRGIMPLVLLCGSLLFEDAYRLNVVGVWEQVDRLHAQGFVTDVSKSHDIACPGGGIAADISQAMRSRFGDAFSDTFGKPRPWWVHDEGVEVTQQRQFAGAVPADDVKGYSVGFGVTAQIAHG